MSQFDWKSPTCAMLGAFQPWTEEHSKEFESVIKRSKQVVVWVQEADKTVKRPHDFIFVRDQIEQELSEMGYNNEEDFIIQPVPYVVDFVFSNEGEYRITRPFLGQTQEPDVIDSTGQTLN